jgi:hypothetical protein
MSLRACKTKHFLFDTTKGCGKIGLWSIISCSIFWGSARKREADKLIRAAGYPVEDEEFAAYAGKGVMLYCQHLRSEIAFISFAGQV